MGPFALIQYHYDDSGLSIKGIFYRRQNTTKTILVRQLSLGPSDTDDTDF